MQHTAKAIQIPWHLRGEFYFGCIYKRPTSTHRHLTNIRLLMTSFYMMLAEMSSPFSLKMTDVFADLSKDERVEPAVRE
jgi:hypothetical protein